MRRQAHRGGDTTQAGGLTGALYNRAMIRATGSTAQLPARRLSIAMLMVLATLVGAAGCGQTGPLYLPTEPDTAQPADDTDDEQEETTDSAPGP